MRIVSSLLSVVLSAVYAFSGFLALVSPTPDKYDIPIDSQQGGEPFIVEDESGTYYTYTLGNRIEIRKIAAYNDTTLLESKVVYCEGNDGILWDIWAPEIHKIGDRWYIVASALFDKNSVPEGTMPQAKERTEHSDYYRYGFVLESKTQDVLGEYEFKGRIAPDGLNNIDATYLQKDGRLYYVCSAYVDVAHQALYIAEMENPYTLKTDENGKNNAVMISRPELHWEKRGWKVNEGPAVLYNDGRIFLVYSASGFSSGGYCMGMLTLCGDDVMRAESWSKSLVSVYAKQAQKNIYHTGHPSFLYRENGDVYMVYHATDNEDFSASPRCTYIKKLEFKNGLPEFY